MPTRTKRKLAGPGEGMPRRGKAWVVQDNTSDNPRAPTHRGYARLKAGTLVQLGLWLVEDPETSQQYLEGTADVVFESGKDRDQDKELKATLRAERRAKRQTKKSPAVGGAEGAG